RPDIWLPLDVVQIAGTAAEAPASAGRAGTFSRWPRLVCSKRVDLFVDSPRARGSLLVWPRLAYCERVRFYDLSMNGLHGRSSAFRRSHGDKPETARAIIGAGNRQTDLCDVAM